MKTESTCKAALYMRLSRDDGAGESASIATQRKILERYAAENGYSIFDEYVDDGWSGTNFDRPAFQRMIADIEAKKIDLVITKDLSRLGRDYITAGQFTEIYFPSKGVRYIAINDGYDSDGPYTDIAPFKNVINEMYARDTSKKIRSALTAKMRDGAYIAAFAPYGYQKDPANKNRLITDGQSGQVVKTIFRMAANGAPPIEIARRLNAQGIPSPAVYRRITHEGLEAGSCSGRQEWTSATITKLLRNVVYLGHVAQGKTTKVSFKSHLTINNPPEEWIVVNNTHEALIGQETFDLVQRRITARTCGKKGCFVNQFSGIAKCADCGRNLSATGTRKKGSPASLTCSGYKLYGSHACSNHFIDYNALYAIVRASLKAQFQISQAERASILDRVQLRLQKQRKKYNPSAALTPIKSRMGALTHILAKLYEDNASGRLSDLSLNRLLAKYEQEARLLEGKIATIQATSHTPHPLEAVSREALGGLLQQLTDVDALTAKVLFSLFDHIEVGQGQYERSEHSRVKRQTIKIFYRFETAATVSEHEF